MLFDGGLFPRRPRNSFSCPRSVGKCPGVLHSGAAVPESGDRGWQVAGMRPSNRPTAPGAVCVGPRFACCCSSDTVAPISDDLGPQGSRSPTVPVSPIPSGRCSVNLFNDLSAGARGHPAGPCKCLFAAMALWASQRIVSDFPQPAGRRCGQPAPVIGALANAASVSCSRPCQHRVARSDPSTVKASRAWSSSHYSG
jgi:hypothetical protein